jgi:hypothetical protein
MARQRREEEKAEQPRTPVQQPVWYGDVLPMHNIRGKWTLYSRRYFDSAFEYGGPSTVPQREIYVTVQKGRPCVPFCIQGIYTVTIYAGELRIGKRFLDTRSPPEANVAAELEMTSQAGAIWRFPLQSSKYYTLKEMVIIVSDPYNSVQRKILLNFTSKRVLNLFIPKEALYEDLPRREHGNYIKFVGIMEQTEDEYFNKPRGKARYGLSIRDRDEAIRELKASALRKRAVKEARGE